MNYLSLFFFATACFAAPPNILWITIEDTSPQFIGCYGNAEARTPVIDRLAHEGVRFVNAFSSGTVCAPSRFTLITGVPTSQTGTGHHRSNYSIPDSITGFPAFLKRAGYYTTNNFKTDYNTAAAQRIIAESWHENSRQAGWWNRQPGQPFFAVFNFMESHQSRTMTDSYEKYRETVLDQLSAEERVGDHDFALPPFYRDSPEMRAQMARVYNALKLTDQRIGELLERLRRDGLAENTIVFFFSDHGQGIPRAKTNGIALGYRVPFVIWFPPQYRDLSPWGTATVSEELISFADLAPTLLSLANVQAPSYLQGRAFLGRKRTAPPEFVFGSTDRSDESTDLVRSVTDGRYFYSRNFLPFMPETRWIEYQEVSAIKKEIRRDHAAGRLDAEQRRMLEARPTEYLFDLRSDPWERHNLAETRDSGPRLQRMRRAVEENIVRSRDIHFLPEYEMALATQSTTPYDYRSNRASYPIEEIYAAARLSGRRGKEIAREQATLLRSTNRVIRYWAILGLKSQPAELLKPHAGALAGALKDDYPPVRIMAASVRYDLARDETARNILQDYALDENNHLALLALQGMAYLQEITPFISVIEQVHARSEKSRPDLHSASAVLLARLGAQALRD